MEDLDSSHATTVEFREGYYLVPESEEVRRAIVDRQVVIWFETEFNSFIESERKDIAASKIILGEYKFLPNYIPHGEGGGS